MYTDGLFLTKILNQIEWTLVFSVKYRFRLAHIYILCSKKNHGFFSDLQFERNRPIIKKPKSKLNPFGICMIGEFKNWYSI